MSIDKKKVALIDADSIVYAGIVATQVCYDIMKGEYPRGLQAGWVENTVRERAETGFAIQADPISAYQTVKSSIARLVQDVNATESKLYFTVGRSSFRYKVNPQYKANRKGKSKTPPLGAVYNYVMGELVANYECYRDIDVEADDLVIRAFKDTVGHKVMVSMDKDVYSNIEGSHFNYHKKTYGYMETSREYAFRFPFYQTLAGDSGDGIKGLNRVGIKTAIKKLAHIGNCGANLWDEVVRLYAEQYKTELNAISTMRLVGMHQLQEDGTVKLWTPRDLKDL